MLSLLQALAFWLLNIYPACRRRTRFSGPRKREDSIRCALSALRRFIAQLPQLSSSISLPFLSRRDSRKLFTIGKLSIRKTSHEIFMPAETFYSSNYKCSRLCFMPVPPEYKDLNASIQLKLFIYVVLRLC